MWQLPSDPLEFLQELPVCLFKVMPGVYGHLEPKPGWIHVARRRIACEVDNKNAQKSFFLGGVWKRSLYRQLLCTAQNPSGTTWTMGRKTHSHSPRHSKRSYKNLPRQSGWPCVWAIKLTILIKDSLCTKAKQGDKNCPQPTTTQFSYY